MKNFNVVFDKWIPITTINNSFELVSPKELFERNDCKSFAGDVVENFCILKFLTTLSQSSAKNQPISHNDWKVLRNNYHENVLEYISENKDLFNFFGNNPFLQYDFGKKEEWEPLRLREKISSGNNAVIYTEQVEQTTTIEKVVLDLIVHQNYSVSFGRSFPAPKTCMYKNSPNGNFNFYAELETCKETIWFNMSYMSSFGKPIWETGQSQELTNDFLNYIFPATTKIQISEDLTKMVYKRGLDYSDLTKHNPFLVTTSEKYKTETVERPMSVKESFVFWKDYVAVLITKMEDLPQILKDRRLKLVENVTMNYLGTTFSSNSGFSVTDKLYQGSYVVSHPEKMEDEQYKNFYKDLVTKTTDIISLMKNNIKNSVVRMRQNNTKRYMKGEVKNIYENFVNSKIDILYRKIDFYSQQIFLYDGSIQDMNSWKMILSNCLNEILCLYEDDVLMYHYLTTSIEYIKIKSLLKKEEENE